MMDVAFHKNQESSSCSLLSLPNRSHKAYSNHQFPWLKNLPTGDELKKFTDTLEHWAIEENGQKMLSFYKLMSIRKELPRSAFNLLSPAIFFRAHSPEWPIPFSFRVPVETIVDFIKLKTAFTQNRIAMAKYDPNGNNTLTREQFILYYRTEVMPKVDVLKDLEETFEICYLNTIESMFFFFLDPKHTGRIRITDAIISGFLENAFGLQTNCEEFENWFSPEKTHEVNALFQMFDTNQKNYLLKEDFNKTQNSTFTSTFVERLFETHVALYGERMSYEEFVIFQIAFNHLAHPASLAYFFKILDVNEDGFLTRFELRYFYTELRAAYNGWFMDGAMPEFDDFSDQFFDMIKPVDNGRITLRELLNCKQGYDFILCLISHTEFYRYETRESENGNALDQDSQIPLFGGGDEFGGSEDEISSLPSPQVENVE